jgi:hypothetical protein
MSSNRTRTRDDETPKGGLPAARDDFPGDRTPATVPDFMADAGAGLEGISQDEQVTPFLKTLQGLSPQLNSRKAEYIPGASLGQIFNTGTEEVYDGATGLDVIVCARHYHYGMWAPRAMGGGFRGVLRPTDRVVIDTIARMDEKYGKKGGRFHMPRMDEATRTWSDPPPLHPESGEEVELVESAHLYVFYGLPGHLTSREAIRRAIVPFKSTGLPVYNMYVTKHMGWTWPTKNGKEPGPLWLYKWRLTAVNDSRGKNEFINWRMGLAPPATTYEEAVYMRQDPQLYAEARKFYDDYVGGAVVVDRTAEADSEEMPL